ncbi:hypothetical protein LGH82_03145 [Mesorhizobium sp. PAMC28654]|uniref:hypothetical protein n=1 Tax=Mesorhizobium sp. PAMC28654 TaxID=2880934 RepID=UPI001D0ADA99|nr:hypothetical protein [Mesorhizobium sp. PAMC28654]UDL90387.1 hypothetical protein LGH82_03145 [Mesorhizobium sp. PAMC28654]
MKIKAAVLEEMGLERPYARSLPLKVRFVDLEGPGPGEVGASGASISVSTA